VVKAVRVVVVVVTRSFIRSAVLGCGLLLVLTGQAAVLPEDRADVLYHSYDGGGMDINGPSVLVRKGDGKTYSAYYNYYVDNVSSASIDVVSTGASPYVEERVENGIGVEYLNGKSIMSVGYTSSVENDYVADTVHFGVSTDMFGDLTTVSLGFSRGSDSVYKMVKVGGVKVRDTAFGEKNTDRRTYSVGLTQILTKNMIMAANFETITDEGFLNNPYRQVRYDSGGTNGYTFENYPATRTSNALGLKFRYFLPYRAALHFYARTFADDWGITANSYEVGYTHPMGDSWIFDLRYRLYGQTSADFYRDLFSSVAELNYQARDKELSTFSSSTIGIGISYEFAKSGWWFIEKGSANLVFDHFQFDYDNFRDYRIATPVLGEEPTYSFSANVLQLFVSIWY